MYYLIDHDRRLVLHKHPDFFVVAALADLESPDAAYMVTTLDSEERLYCVPVAQLVELYANTTGAQPTHTGNQLRKLLLEVADRLPVCDVVGGEVERQADWASANRDKGPFVYVKGASRPGKATAPAAGLAASAAGDPAAVLATWAPPAPAPVVRQAVPMGAPATTLQRQPRAPQAGTSSAPRGGQRQLVWDVADRAWEAAGKPTSRPEVLALRKQLMTDLEQEHGVKRTSSSNTLGEWQKARIPE